MSDILSQEELDALLSAYGGRRPSDGLSREVRMYDFTRPERFSKEEIRQIEAVHRTFANRLGNYLSAMLRGTVTVDHTTLDQSTFNEFLKSVPSPTLITTFNIEPAGIPCIIEINPNLVFAMVDFLAGGDGDALLSTREMTEIESRLMEGILKMALSHYVAAWEQFAKISCELDRVGANQMVMPILSAGDQVVCSYFETKVGNQVGLVSLCMPTIAVEAIFEAFGTRSKTISRTTDSTLQAMIADQLKTTEVRLRALLGETIVTINDLMQLREGDLVRLDQPVNRELEITIQGQPKFRGVPGVVGRKMGVHITSLSDSAVDLHKELA